MAIQWPFLGDGTPADRWNGQPTITPEPFVLQSSVDVGRPKVRRLRTKQDHLISGIVSMDGDELDEFKTWFEDTVYSGTETFEWYDIFDRTITDQDYQILPGWTAEVQVGNSDDSDVRYLVSLTLRRLAT